MLFLCTLPCVSACFLSKYLIVKSETRSTKSETNSNDKMICNSKQEYLSYLKINIQYSMLNIQCKRIKGNDQQFEN